MEGAYTELKKAQEAAVKSIKVKRQQVEMRLSSKMLDAGDKDETLDRSLLAPFWAFIIFSCFVCHLFSFLLKHMCLKLGTIFGLHTVPLNPFAPEPPVTARADPGPFYPL